MLKKTIWNAALLLLAGGGVNAADLLPLPPAKAMASQIQVIDDRDLPQAEIMLAATLQGLLNREVGQVALGEIPEWQNVLSKYGVTFQAPENWREVLRKHPDVVKGYILTDEADFNAATTLAGILDALPATPTIAAELEKEFGLSQLADCRDMTQEKLLEKLRSLPEGSFNRNLIANNDGMSPALRDYAAKEKMIYVYSYSNPDLLNDYYQLTAPGGFRMGWNDPYGDEVADVSLAARHGLATVAADHTRNLSLLSSKPDSLTPENWAGPEVAEADRSEGVHFVTFVMSDGDNLNWLLDGMWKARYAGHPRHGEVPIGWMIAPNLSRFAPVVLQGYQRLLTAAETPLWAVSGAGYTYVSELPDAELFWKQTALFNRETQLRYGIVMDLVEWQQAVELVAKLYDAAPDNRGVFYLDYGDYSRWQGRIAWPGGRPMVSARYRLWAGLSDINSVLEQLKAAPVAPEREDGYSMMICHAWSYGYEDLVRMKAQLPPHIKVVSPAVFLETISARVKHR